MPGPHTEKRKEITSFGNLKFKKALLESGSRNEPADENLKQGMHGVKLTFSIWNLNPFLTSGRKRSDCLYIFRTDSIFL